MPMKFDLEKDTAKVRFMLEKRDLAKITAEVVAVVDVSGSMAGLFKHGAMQEALQRVVPVALNFDDNGELPTYLFSSSSQQTRRPITAMNYAEFVKQEITGPRWPVLWGGTELRPVLTDVVRDLGFLGTVSQTTELPMNWFKKLLGAKPETVTKERSGWQQKSTSGLPAIVYVFTDGENTDQRITRMLLAGLASSRSEIYFNFIGMGEASFGFLEDVAEALPNVGFARVADIAAVATDSDELYEYLLPTELTEWLKAFVK